MKRKLEKNIKKETTKKRSRYRQNKIGFSSWRLFFVFPVVCTFCKKLEEKGAV